MVMTMTKDSLGDSVISRNNRTSHSRLNDKTNNHNGGIVNIDGDNNRGGGGGGSWFTRKKGSEGSPGIKQKRRLDDGGRGGGGGGGRHYNNKEDQYPTNNNKKKKGSMNYSNSYNMTSVSSPSRSDAPNAQFVREDTTVPSVTVTEDNRDASELNQQDSEDKSRTTTPSVAPGVHWEARSTVGGSDNGTNNDEKPKRNKKDRKKNKKKKSDWFSSYGKYLLVIFIILQVVMIRYIVIYTKATAGTDSYIIRACPDDYRIHVPITAAPSFVTTNSVGDVVAIGSPRIFPNGTGQVQVRRWLPTSDGEDWVNLDDGKIAGHSISSSSDWFGYSVALNNNMTSFDVNDGDSNIVVAVSDIKAFDGQGGVHVYKWVQAELANTDGQLATGFLYAPKQDFSNVWGRWEQLGRSIYSDAKDINFGASLALSPNGRTLAIGASPYLPGLTQEDVAGPPPLGNTSYPAGFVRVYHLIGLSWTPMGGIINSTVYSNGGDGFGLVIQSVSDYDPVSGSISVTITSPPQYYVDRKETEIYSASDMYGTAGYVQRFQLDRNKNFSWKESSVMQYYHEQRNPNQQQQQR